MEISLNLKVTKKLTIKNPLFKNNNNLTILIVGNIVAFIVALVAIKFFIDFLTKHGFKAFGYYRIIVGGLLLILLGTGIVQNTI